jgi:RNA polymerase sigma-70 factor, ECF subfamily
MIWRTGLIHEDLKVGTTEQSWVRHAQAGDTEAWALLVQTYQQPVFRLAYLLLGDPDDAEDVAQETFIRAYSALNRFDPNLPLRPWLLRITVNLTHNWRRSANRYLAALQRTLSNPDRVSQPPVEDRQDADLLWQAVRRLSTKDQQVVYLRYFLDCSEEDMARVLHTARGTVKSRLHRALGRLKAILPAELQPGEEAGNVDAR